MHYVRTNSLNSSRPFGLLQFALEIRSYLHPHGAVRFGTTWSLLLSDDRYTFPFGLGSVLSTWDVHRVHTVYCCRLLDSDASINVLTYLGVIAQSRWKYPGGSSNAIVTLDLAVHRSTGNGIDLPLEEGVINGLL